MASTTPRTVTMTPCSTCRRASNPDFMTGTLCGSCHKKATKQGKGKAQAPSAKPTPAPAPAAEQKVQAPAPVAAPATAPQQSPIVVQQPPVVDKDGGRSLTAKQEPRPGKVATPMANGGGFPLLMVLQTVAGLVTYRPATLAEQLDGVFGACKSGDDFGATLDAISEVAGWHQDRLGLELKGGVFTAKATPVAAPAPAPTAEPTPAPVATPKAAPAPAPKAAPAPVAKVAPATLAKAAFFALAAGLLASWSKLADTVKLRTWALYAVSGMEAAAFLSLPKERRMELSAQLKDKVEAFLLPQTPAPAPVAKPTPAPAKEAAAAQETKAPAPKVAPAKPTTYKGVVALGSDEVKHLADTLKVDINGLSYARMCSAVWAKVKPAAPTKAEQAAKLAKSQETFAQSSKAPVAKVEPTKAPAVTLADASADQLTAALASKLGVKVEDLQAALALMGK